MAGKERGRREDEGGFEVSYGTGRKYRTAIVRTIHESVSSGWLADNFISVNSENEVSDRTASGFAKDDSGYDSRV